MTLPKIKHPVRKISIPSTGENITIRPMTVKEEKILMISKESTDNQDQISSVSQIIRNCVIEDDFDLSSCASFDAEYIFLNIISMSIQNEYELLVKDDHGKNVPCVIDLNKVKVKFPEKKISSKIMLDDNLGIEMKFITFADLEEASKLESENEVEEYMFLLKRCIRSIFDAENVYDEFSDEELTEFIDDLTKESFDKIVEFFDNMPALRHTVKTKDSKGKEFEFELNGLSDFFIF